MDGGREGTRTQRLDGFKNEHGAGAAARERSGRGMQGQMTHQGRRDEDRHHHLIQPNVLPLPDGSSSNPEGVGSRGNEEGGDEGEEERHDLDSGAVSSVSLRKDGQS